MSEVAVRRQPESIGTDLAKRSEPKTRCKVCRMGYHIVGQVNRQIINGASYSEIHAFLWDLKNQGIVRDAPGYQGVVNHAKKHLPYKDAAVRRVIEKRAQERNIDLENGVQNLLNEFSVAETVMKVGFQQLMEGKKDVPVKDMLAAAKMVNEFTKDAEGSLDAASAMAEMGYILQAVQEIVPAEYWDQISDRVRELSNNEIVEAEVFEEDEDDA
jgi:hypothetical protein